MWLGANQFMLLILVIYLKNEWKMGITTPARIPTTAVLVATTAIARNMLKNNHTTKHRQGGQHKTDTSYCQDISTDKDANAMVLPVHP
jgi:hypothetical protein